jgi:magnesium transporter
MAKPIKLVSVQPAGIPGVVASVAYAEGRRVANIAIEEAGDWSRKPGHVVWIGLHEPGLDLLRKVQGQFGLHELAIEDALKAHQRPKLEQYGEALSVVARTAQMLDGRIAFGETHLFVGGTVNLSEKDASILGIGLSQAALAIPATSAQT